MPRKTPLLLLLDPEAKAWLESRSMETGLAQNEIVRQAVQTMMDGSGRRPPTGSITSLSPSGSDAPTATEPSKSSGSRRVPAVGLPTSANQQRDVPTNFKRT